MSYNPNQPREPKGISTGGQWVSEEMTNTIGAARKAAGLPPIDTYAQYRNSRGEWTPERKALHKKIVDSFFVGKTPVENPEAILMGGGPASGKSSVLRSGQVEVDPNTVFSDSDKIKSMLPEYKEEIDSGNLMASSVVHEESSFLCKEIVNRASTGGYNVGLDGTGDNTMNSLRNNIARMTQGGQNIRAVYVSCDTEEAVRRNISRGQETGRYVPSNFMRRSHKMVSVMFPDIIRESLFDSVELYDNNSSAPKLIAYTEGGYLVVNDDSLYKRFLSKGD